MLKRYRVSEVSGDRYSAEWSAQAFNKFGVHYRPSEKNRSEIYLEFLPAVMSGAVELLDNRRLVSQLAGLERVTGRGRDVIDHQPGGDDVANAAAGALVLVVAGGGVLGVVEVLKLVDSGKVQLPDELAIPNRPPKPNAQPGPDETRTCAMCGNVIRMHPESKNTWVCVGCGHVETISRIILHNPSRGEHLRREDDRRTSVGRGSLRRFGS